MRLKTRIKSLSLNGSTDYWIPKEVYEFNEISMLAKIVYGMLLYTSKANRTFMWGNVSTELNISGDVLKELIQELVKFNLAKVNMDKSKGILWIILLNYNNSIPAESYKINILNQYLDTKERKLDDQLDKAVNSLKLTMSKQELEAIKQNKLSFISKLNKRLSNEVIDDVIDETNTITLVEFYKNEFKKHNGHFPKVEKSDDDAVKKLIKEYGFEDMKKFIVKYLELKDKFLLERGHILRFMPHSINTIIAQLKNTKQNNFKDVAYMKNASDEQLLDYLNGRKDGKYDGSEEWEKAYIEEAKKRGLTI